MSVTLLLLLTQQLTTLRTQLEDSLHAFAHPPAYATTTTLFETTKAQSMPPPPTTQAFLSAPESVHKVPFYSQFRDISAPEWRKVGCGIASIAMAIDYHSTKDVSVDDLLAKGIAADAFLSDAGWTHQGLINLAAPYGLTGGTHDLRGTSPEEALGAMRAELTHGPVIASVHYRFDPHSTIPHLVVIDGIEGDTVYYNDPAEDHGGKQLPVSAFLRGWKQRYITVHPG